MKKNYAKPTTIMLTMINEDLIAISMTQTEASDNAVTLSREDRGDSFWDDTE